MKRLLLSALPVLLSLSGFAQTLSKDTLTRTSQSRLAAPNGVDVYSVPPAGQGPATLFFQTASKTMAEVRTMNSVVRQQLPQVIVTTDAGQGGTWALDLTDKQSVDNTGTVLVTSNGFRYKRQFYGPIQLDWFLVANVADDAPAIQKALDAAFTSRVKVVKVRKANYTIATPISIPIGVILEGDMDKPTYKTVLDANIDSPTLNILTAQNVNVPAFTLLYNAGIKNFTFYWPLQLKTNTIPIPYGWAITTNGLPSNGDGVLIENIMLTNCYNGINIDFGGQWDIRNVKGQTLNTGIQLDRVFDASRLEDIHFWDFWAGGGDAIKPYILANAEAIRVGRVDGLQASNIFVWSHKNMLHFYQSDHASPAESGSAWCLFNNVKSDLNTVPIQIDRVNRLQISNLNGTSYDITDGHSFIETSTNVIGSVSISNAEVFHTNALANITSSTGIFKFTNTTKQSRGDGNDVTGYKVINQTANPNVYVDEANYNDVSGLVQVGSHVRWTTDEDVTSSLPNFTNFSQWTITSNQVSAINNGYRFNLGNGGISVLRYVLPNTFFYANAVYVLECDVQLNNPANLGPGQFYMRFTDGNTNDVVFPSSPIQNYYPTKTRLRIPLLARRFGTVFDFIFGNASGPCSMDVTNLKLYRVGEKNLTQSLVDWLNVKQPNSLGDPALNLARRRQITTGLSMDIEPNAIGEVNTVNATPITLRLITAKATRGEVVWIKWYDANQNTPITVTADAGLIQDATGTFVGPSMTFPTGSNGKALGFFFDGANTHCIRSY